jgi:hypothetical protein
MRYVLNCIVAVLWALWLGGLITMFISVTALFGTDENLAKQAAPVLFVRFELYQMILAGTAVAAGVIWHVSERSSTRLAIALLFILAGVGATVARTAITPRMESLRLKGESGGAEFKSLHGQSMLIYLTDTAALVLAGLALPAAMAGDKRQKV